MLLDELSPAKLEILMKGDSSRIIKTDNILSSEGLLTDEKLEENEGEVKKDKFLESETQS